MLRMLKLCDSTQNIIYSSAPPQEEVEADKAQLWVLKWQPLLRENSIKHVTLSFSCMICPLPSCTNKGGI